MKPWFTIDEIDDRTHIISEYRHWEETHCYLPEGYDVSTYEFFQGTPTRVLHDGDVIELGDRSIDVFHTPGHSPGHMCFWEASTAIFLPAIWSTKIHCLRIIHLQIRRNICAALKNRRVTCREGLSRPSYTGYNTYPS